MIRTIIKATGSKITIDIPEKYIGKELEVIAFSRDEGLNDSERNKKVSFTVLHTEFKNYKFNRDEANER